MILGAHVSTAGDFVGTPARAAAMGCKAVQIFAGSPRTWRQKVYSVAEGDAFKAACKQADVIPFIHMLYLTSYGTNNDELRTRSIDAMGKMLITADTIGAVGVITHLGSHNGLGYEASAERLAAGILEAIKLSGDTKSYAILENSAGAGGNMGNSIEELADIYERTGRHPRVKICIDTCHLLTSGTDFRTQQGLDDFLAKFDKLIGLENLVAMHINDSKFDVDAKKDRHENIGDGFVGNDAFKLLVNHPRLANVPGMLEVPGLDGKGPDKANLDRLYALKK